MHGFFEVVAVAYVAGGVQRVDEVAVGGGVADGVVFFVEFVDGGQEGSDSFLVAGDDHRSHGHDGHFALAGLKSVADIVGRAGGDFGHVAGEVVVED